MSYCYKSYLTIEESKNNAHRGRDLEDLIIMCQQSILPPAHINSLSDAIVTVMAYIILQFMLEINSFMVKQLFFLMCMIPSTN